MVLGRPYLWTGLCPPYVLNFPTKAHWRSASRLSDITAGLDYLAENIESWGISSLAVPPLGCGEGGLEWRMVRPLLLQRLAALPVPVVLYAPLGSLDKTDAELPRCGSAAQRSRASGSGGQGSSPRAHSR